MRTVFFAVRYDEENANKLATTNKLNTAIKFTLETPVDNRLPFLDTMVTLNKETGRFDTKLYVKPIHSQCITPWDSHGPFSQKRGILIGEIRRATSRSTNRQSLKDSLELIKDIYVNNGYPKAWVNNTIKRTLRKNRATPQEQEQDYIYVKIPFINEDLKRQTQAIIKRTGLNNIRIIYINGRPSARIFKPPREKQQCPPNNCDTCTNALIANTCLIKNIVYKIHCKHCKRIYIGESSKTVRSRLKEHLSMKKQTIYMHLQTHTSSPTLQDISWEILHRNIKDTQTRRAIEALEIQRNNDIINGCSGRYLAI